MDKPHLGAIENWGKAECKSGLGYYIVGLFVNHPQFEGSVGHTSYIIAHEGDEIETRNSRYTLIGEEYVPS